MNKEEYNIRPKKCVSCNKPIPFSKRRNKFCDHSCSASYTNTGRIHTQDTKIKIKMSLSRPKIYQSSKVYFTHCLCCKKIHTTKTKRNIYCLDCKKIDKVLYKKESSFKLNKKDHPELFNSSLIKKYGWFISSGPKKNRQGVSWDHLYPLHLGFENSVDPNIMSHPANAELVPHDENLRRYHEHKQMITYDELIIRINKWESGNRILKKFYYDKTII